MSMEDELKQIKQHIQGQGGVSVTSKSRTPKILNKFMKGSKLKSNHAIVMYIRTNSNIEINSVAIDNDLVYIKQTGLYHKASADYILKYKKYPVLIIPEYSIEPLKVKPFNPREHYKTVEQEGKVSHPQRVFIQMLRLSMLPKKNKLPNKNMIWYILGAIVVLYFIASYFGKV